MLFDPSQPLSIAQYLGCLHAFVGQFQSEIFMVKSLSLRLRGHSRAEVFGWAASLDETRYRIPLIVDRWQHFSQSARERMVVSDADLTKYAPLPDHNRADEVCRELADMVGRTNRFIDELDMFLDDDVRMIGEMVDALDRELDTDHVAISRIAEEMDTEEDVSVTPDDSTGLLMINGSLDNPGPGQEFAAARDLFSAHLRTGC